MLVGTGSAHKPLFFLALLYSAITACSTTIQNNKVLFEDPRGTVSLQAISDQSIQASHPINLEPALIARVLSGMQVQEGQRGLQELIAGSATVVPAGAFVRSGAAMSVPSPANPSLASALIRIA